jgi:[CysO sulfur-carrier protein]-S-L-cysteine hydrolase
MKLHLHPDQLQSMARHLRKAGASEIGGVLVGEHVAENEFRLVDLSFQRSTGTEACFIRRPEEHKRFFSAFFRRTGEDFRRFNYLGEWHSHPAFPAVPSGTDEAQMQAIIEDGPNAPLFAVLIVARLNGPGDIELNASAHRRGCAVSPVTMHLSPRPRNDPAWVPRPWWRRVLEREPKAVRLSCSRVEEGAPGHSSIKRSGAPGRTP